MKKIIIPIIIIICFILILTPREFYKEISTRLALYHNTAKITATIDGKPCDVDGIDVNFDAYNNAKRISNGKVKFSKGMYGENTFSLTIPNENTNGVNIEFGVFNTNEWHVLNYDINVDVLNNDDGTANVTLTANINGDDMEEVLKETKTITEHSNKISVSCQW